MRVTWTCRQCAHQFRVNEQYSSWRLGEGCPECEAPFDQLLRTPTMGEHLREAVSVGANAFGVLWIVLIVGIVPAFVSYFVTWVVTDSETAAIIVGIAAWLLTSALFARLSLRQ